jgi:hypothetical protein
MLDICPDCPRTQTQLSSSNQTLITAHPTVLSSKYRHWLDSEDNYLTFVAAVMVIFSLFLPSFPLLTSPITSSSDARSQPQRHFVHDIMPALGIVAWTLSVFFVLSILVTAAFARYHTRILVITNDA